MAGKKQMQSPAGKVYLVGAGPGDAGLLTVKGRRVLQEADVVVYDHLAGDEVLAAIGNDKEMIHVGKMAGRHPVSQEQINQILVEEAGKGKIVVRLKGGDPFLFGRGGEELEELERQGILFEVVPGVTSPLAVPAYNGIPVTHRDYASSLHIVTGHRREGGAAGIHYRALVEAGGTLVFLMGVTALSEIVTGLLEAGMDSGMPAAILQEGTTSRQKRIITTLSRLVKEAEKAGIRPPAIIVVGKVCSLSDRLSWREKLSLAGMCVLLTRPKEQAAVTAEKLRKLGAQVLEIPAIDTVPLKKQNRLEKCLMKIQDYHWIVFTSQAGVRIFFEEMSERKQDIRCLFHLKFAVIGSGTQKELCKQGIYADLMPEVYEGRALGELLAEQNIAGQRILIPRAEKGNRLLVPILKEAGAVVDDVPIYRTEYRECVLSVRELLDKDRADCVIFTSSSTVEGFAAVSKGADYSKITAACIGRQTAESAAKYGMKCYISEEASVDSLVELVERIKKENDKKTSKIKEQ